MKTLRYYLLVVFILLCRWSAAQERETRNPGPFTGIDISDRVLVQLLKADEESLEISTQRSDASGVITAVEDNTLNIRVRGSSSEFGKVNIILKYRHIDDISVSGMAEVSSISPMKADTLSIDLRGGGKAYLDLDLVHLDCRIHEGAVLSAQGRASSLDAHVTTSGALSAFDLQSDLVVVKAVTGGIAKVYAGKSLVANAQTKGYISYRGDPDQAVTNRGTGGSIEKADLR
jgi:hypothetical protein